MAPIASAVRSTILHTAPSRNKRASSATNNPALLIGISVSIICFVIVIGAGWFFIWRRRRAVRRLSDGVEEPSELDTTYGRQKHRYEQNAPRITPELDGNVTPVEAGATATLPRYPELLRRPHELASAEKSDFTELGRYSEPEQFVDCNERIEQEHLPIGQSEHPDQTIYLPDSERQRVHSLIPLPLRSGTSDMEMQSTETSTNADELHMREPTPNWNRTSIDVGQRANAWPLRDTKNQLDLEIQRQIGETEGTPEHDKMEVDAISTFSPTPRAAGPSRAFSPPLVSNLAPRRRVAVLDLHPLETDNRKAERDNDQSKGRDSNLNQRRRQKQRTLMPKSSSPQNSKTTSSPQSSKSTPDSAKTKLSFASTATNATHATSPGSAITTPSMATESPASSWSPQENSLECQTCGQLFSTAGRQKKHYNRIHNLRYVCDICARPFGVRADLERHEHTVHAEFFRSLKRSWCTIPGCPTPNKEWKRKDNFTRHVRSCEARAADKNKLKGKERAVE
ncbi:unnamed protein product [Alternaria alternata]